MFGPAEYVWVPFCARFVCVTFVALSEVRSSTAGVMGFVLV